MGTIPGTTAVLTGGTAVIGTHTEIANPTKFLATEEDAERKLELCWDDPWAARPRPLSSSLPGIRRTLCVLGVNVFKNRQKREKHQKRIWVQQVAVSVDVLETRVAVAEARDNLGPDQKAAAKGV